MSHRFPSPATVAAGLAAMLVAPASAAEYVQASDAASTLVFASRYDGEVFTGRFPGFSTRLSFDPAKPAGGRLEVTIPLAGTVSGNTDRDSTLKSADFFNVARFAEATYSARGFRALGDGQYAADGTLSLRGVSKPVTLTFTWTPGAQPVLTGKATVRRLEFGVGGGDWADTRVLPDEVAISTKVVFEAAP